MDALEEALSKGKPEVFNTDQGSQFTSEAFTGLLEQLSESAWTGRAVTDNLFIERLWRSLKYVPESIPQDRLGEYFRTIPRGRTRPGISDSSRGIHI